MVSSTRITELNRDTPGDAAPLPTSQDDGYRLGLPAPNDLLMRILVRAVAIAALLGLIYIALYLRFGSIADLIGVGQCFLTGVAFLIARVLGLRGRMTLAMYVTVNAVFVTSLVTTVLAYRAFPFSVLLTLSTLVIALPYLNRQEMRRVFTAAFIAVLGMGVVHIFSSPFQLDRPTFGRFFLVASITTVFLVICRQLMHSQGWLVELLHQLNRANTDLRFIRDKLEERVEERTSQLRRANDKLLEEIEERRRAEMRLVAAETQARAERDLAQQVMNTMGEGLVLLDHDFRITFVNPALAQMIGRPVDQLIGQGVFDYLLDDLPALESKFGSTRNNPGAVLDVPIRRTNGEEAWLRVIGAQPFSNRDERGYMAMAMDVTQRRSVELRLRLLESAVANARDAVLITDAALDGAGPVIVYANLACTTVTGYSIEALVGATPQKLYGPKTSRSGLSNLMKAMREGRGTEYELINYRQDGSEFWAEWTISPVRDEHGAITNWVALVRETTERKHTETQLVRQNEFLAALHEMTVGLINRFDSEHLFDSVIERVCRLLNCDHGYIALVNEQLDQLETTASFGTLLVESPDRPRKKGEGLSGKVWESGQPVWLSNYGEWRGHVPDLSVPYPVAVAPLKSGGRVVGVIGMVRANRHHPFEDGEIELLLRFGQLAALIYDNTQLYRASQHELTERRRIEDELRGQNVYLAALHQTTLGLIDRLDAHELLETVLYRAAELLDVKHAFLDLYSESEGRTSSFAGMGLFDVDSPREFVKGEGLSGMVWQTGQSIVIDNYDRWPHRSKQVPEGLFYACIGVPLKSGGLSVGVIGMVRVTPGRPFTATEVNTLERFAQLASVAYDNSQLYEQLRANEQKLELRVRERTSELTRALEENEKLRASSIQAAAAAERSRLARELHDSVSQAIYGIALGARTMQQLSVQNPEDHLNRMSEPLTYIVSLADAALAEIRALIFELRPESLEKEGVLAAIKKQTDALRARYGLQIEAALCDREPEATLDVKEALYRIALEAMHNTVKHAHAQKIFVALSELPDQDALVLRLTDDGVGFDLRNVGAGQMGLKNMEDRVMALGGRFELRSAVGAGTVLQVTLNKSARAHSKDAIGNEVTNA